MSGFEIIASLSFTPQLVAFELSGMPKECVQAVYQFLSDGDASGMVILSTNDKGQDSLFKVFHMELSITGTLRQVPRYQQRVLN